jgi:stage V sporulation protein T
MRATGIIRRIDDLGRVVIQKEIRRTMGIREGEPFEIFVGKDSVTFKRFNPNQELKEELLTLVDSYDTNAPVDITNKIRLIINELK